MSLIYKVVIGVIIVLGLAAAAGIWQRQRNKLPEPVASTVVAPSTTAPEVTAFATTSPTDPYDPMPLRVGTVGAAIYHRPFCPYAKQSLIKHGIEKRINYWTREEVATNNRAGDTFCMASIFDCSDVQPTDFVTLGNDPWCGANIRLADIGVQGIDPKLAGKQLCNLQGHIGFFVDDPLDCNNGNLSGSALDCDHAACGSCTTDCETACFGCVVITLAILNEVTLGMGDASGDGETDVSDYLFYHECYSGSSTASIPCQNVFDYDQDHDVDEQDFDEFVKSYNSGNVSWAATNHPDAVINQDRLELPLRVGTTGSLYYHRLDCPSVNNSWETWGMDRREEFYTWDQIEDSGRVPDMNVCLPGTRQNPSGTLQNCTLDDDADGILNCDDMCPENPDANCVEEF